MMMCAFIIVVVIATNNAPPTRVQCCNGNMCAIRWVCSAVAADDI